MDFKDIKTFLYSFLFSPQETISIAVKRREDEHMGMALLVLVITIVFNLLAKAIIALNTKIIDVYLGIGGVIYVLNFIGNIIIFLSIVFFIRSFSISNERNPKKKNLSLLLFKLICFSFLPLVFAPVISLFGLFFGASQSLTIYYILKAGLIIWIGILQILIIKNVFRLKFLTSFALYILPLIGILAFVFLKIINISLSVITLIL